MFGGNEKARAVEFAQKVARLLRIGVQDLCVESGEVTAGSVVVDKLGPEDAD